MKISNELINSILIKNEEAKNINLKNLVSSFKSGDSFKAEIINIKADTIKINFYDGIVLEAKSDGMLNVRIGQNTEFIVKENNGGKIIVEIEKNNNASLRDILNTADVPVTKENMQIIKELIKNDCPINKETIDRAMFFYHGDENPNMEKMIFMIKENMPATSKMLDALNQLIDRENGIKADIIGIAEEIAVMKDDSIRKEILNVLGIEDKKSNTDELAEGRKINYEKPIENNKMGYEELFKNVKEKLFINFEKGENIEKAAEKFANIEKLINIGHKINDENYEVLKTKLENIESKTEFMRNMETKDFFQIPMMINGSDENAELYVFKDKKKKNKDYSKNASLFLSMDYANLGRVDTFIEKEYRNVGLQFTLENEKILKLVKQNYDKLEGLMKEKGYSISNISFKTADKKSELTNNSDDRNEPDVDEEKRFCFDLRV